MLCLCQAGYEAFLERELGPTGRTIRERGPGWVLATNEAGSTAPEFTFAHTLLFAPKEVQGDSVNALAQGILEFFLTSLKGERIDSAWPSRWQAPAETVGLSRRAASVEQAFEEQLRKRLSRVAKLATVESPRGIGPTRGLFVWFSDFGRAFVSREAFTNGQCRMSDDPQAPSRSYLKVEEAYGILGRQPADGETVVDLGAAPGGWSYSAACRGAHVIAIDNGPLKGGALGHPRIEHRREDAFKFFPSEGQVFDWLFCDLVEEPHHVLQHIVIPWLERGWCRHFVLNFKFGRVDPIALLDEMRSHSSPFSMHARGFRIRHLYHDREEFTVVGSVSGHVGKTA